LTAASARALAALGFPHAPDSHPVPHPLVFTVTTAGPSLKAANPGSPLSPAPATALTLSCTCTGHAAARLAAATFTAHMLLCVWCVVNSCCGLSHLGVPVAEGCSSWPRVSWPPLHVCPVRLSVWWRWWWPTMPACGGVWRFAVPLSLCWLLGDCG
jgi:hypothetical protein